MILETKNIEFSHNEERSFSYPDIQLESSGQLLILGKSGTGKTTLLHILCGLLKPKQGHVFIDGTNIFSLDSSQLDKFRGKNIGIVFQQAHLLKSLTVEENLKSALFFSQKKESTEEIYKLVEQLGLQQFIKKNVGKLSVGEQQRVAIARALIHKPKILFADEPTSSLDDENTANVVQLLKEQTAKFQTSLVIVTHDFRLKSLFSSHIQL